MFLWKDQFYIFNYYYLNYSAMTPFWGRENAASVLEHEKVNVSWKSFADVLFPFAQNDCLILYTEEKHPTNSIWDLPLKVERHQIEKATACLLKIKMVARKPSTNL
jgi:hypothetical protein